MHAKNRNLLFRRVVLPWRGLPGKGKTKSKAPVGKHGGLGITV